MTASSCLSRFVAVCRGMTPETMGTQLTKKDWEQSLKRLVAAKLLHPMPTKKPGYSLRTWISNDDLGKLKKLSETTKLSQVEILTLIVHAGIEVLSEKGKITLPLKFAEPNEHESPIGRAYSQTK